MTWAKKRRLILKYNRDSHLYDIRYYREQKAKMLASLNTVTIDSEDLVLDVGCGTGILFEFVVDSAGLTVGLDFSRGLLSMAKKRSEDYKDVELILADADYLPLRDESFNGVFAFTLLQNSPTPYRTMREIVRICKVDGCMVITGLKKRFSRKDFEALIGEHDLITLKFIDDVNLKDYIVVCKKDKSHPIRRGDPQKT